VGIPLSRLCIATALGPDKTVKTLAVLPYPSLAPVTARQLGQGDAKEE